MTATLASPAWSRRRWGWAVGAAVVIQVGLIFWLGDHSLPTRRSAGTEPQVFLAPNYTNELAALNNPTLFAFAGPQGFSGLAWRQLPPLQYQPADWTEPPRFLALRAEDLGAVVHQVLQSNVLTTFEVAVKTEPTILRPVLPLPVDSLSTQSVVRVEGGLAARRLLTPFDLPPVAAGDLVPNSVVQVLVDADGWTQSATLLSSSGLPAADQRALDLARSARFESVRGTGPEASRRSLPELTWGTLVFSWYTVPLPATNAPAVVP